MLKSIASIVFEGHLVGKPDEQLVLLFMLGSADQNGICSTSPRMISAITGLSPGRVDAAIHRLYDANAESRWQDHDGRMIIPAHVDIGFEVISGWQIVNFDLYRNLQRKDLARERSRRYAKNKRAVMA